MRTDRLRAAWDALDRRWAQGWDDLDDADRQTIALWWLEAETDNGALPQYFGNSSGDMALIALAGLERLGMTGTRDVLVSAMEFFGTPYPVDRVTRLELLDRFEEEHTVEEMDDLFGPETEYIQDRRERVLDAALEDLLRDPSKRPNGS